MGSQTLRYEVNEGSGGRGVVRLPLGAETGDISRVERFRWFILEAAAGMAIYGPLLGKKPATDGDIMEGCKSNRGIR
jgi:hypothetical protein